MDGSYIDDSLVEVALRSFRESLERASNDLKNAQHEYFEAEQRLREAEQKRDEYQKACDDLTRLISSIEIRNVAERLGVAYTVSRDSFMAASTPNFDEEDEDEEAELDGTKRKRKRLKARPKTLEIIQQANRLVSVDEVIDLVKAAYSPIEIQDKTIKNAVWDLTASEELIKFYSKELREYIYGIPEWFDSHGNPKPLYERIEAVEENSTVSNSTSFFDFEESELPF